VTHLVDTAMLDLRLQARHKLFAVGIVVAVSAGIAARALLAVAAVSVLLPGIWLGAVGSTTFMFVAGMVLLEKGERTLDALIVTPLDVGTYLASKVLTLTGFALVESLIVLVLGHGIRGVSFGPLVLGITFLGAMYTLAGIAQVVTHSSVTDFLVPGAFVSLTLLQLPFLDAFGVWSHPLLYLVPTQATVVLMKGAFTDLSLWQWGYGVGYSSVSIGAAAWLAHRRFERHIVTGSSLSSGEVVARTGGTATQGQEVRHPVADIAAAPATQSPARTTGPPELPTLTCAGIARGLVVTDVKHISRDRFIPFLLAYSLVLAAAVRFGVPPLTAVLSRRYGIDLMPYYGLISSFVALTAGASLVGLVLGFLLLDARETRLLDAISVTPLTFDRFVAYRVAMPMVLAAGLNPLCAWIGGIGLPALGPMLLLALAGVPFAGIGTLAVATFADNKVQAFAILKLLGGVGMLPMVAYFIDAPQQYLFGLFPPYWIFKAWWVAVEGGSAWWAYALIGLLTNLALLAWMTRRFEQVVRRGSVSTDS
jgi:hypothetical protein